MSFLRRGDLRVQDPGPTPVVVPLSSPKKATGCRQQKSGSLWAELIAGDCHFAVEWPRLLGVTYKVTWGRGEIAQPTKAPATKPHDLNSTPRTHMVERTKSYKLLYYPTNALRYTSVFVPVDTIYIINKYQKYS